ncbi:MAG: Gfo/Idh/MocA family oxidoreductase [Bryobacteraceae bacterium]
MTASGKVRWGILSTSKFAQREVIPAIQQSERGEVTAIASRDPAKGRQCAERFGIGRVYGSYEDLLADPEIEAVYNPLPNSLHEEWSVKAAEAGKHVMCEKPFAMDASGAMRMEAAFATAGRIVREGFMIRFHPQWQRAKAVVEEGRIGNPRAVQALFSYTNVDPGNIRNKPETGGGALYDIGCYGIVSARYIFGEEPVRAICLMDIDPAMKTDRMTTAILDFPSGHGSFTCSTQMVPSQRVQILGTKGRIEIEIPYNAPAKRDCRIVIDDASAAPSPDGAATEALPAVNQYVVQFDAFSRAVREGGDLEYPPSDAVANMKIIDALFRSAKSRCWETVG